MLEVVFLGTAGGVPAVERGLPALMVRHRQHRFLVDCGEGTQRQLLKSGLGFRRLEGVLLSPMATSIMSWGSAGLPARSPCSAPGHA